MAESPEYIENLCRKIAWYYYFENMTQQQIANQVGVSRMRVIKLLDRAKSDGIIQFKMRSDSEHRMTLEKAMQRKYGLDNVILIPSGSDYINESVARAAACYLEERLPQDGFINVGYGDTIQRILNNLYIPADSNLSLISLTGGVSYYVRYGESVNKRFTSTPNSKLYLVPSPLIASTEEMANAFLKETSIRKILDMATLAKMTIIGIGSVSEDATIYKDGQINANDLVLLRMHGAVGDIMSQFFDKNGEKIDIPLHRRLISTPLSVLKEIDNVIAVAGGVKKAAAIDAALKGGYINTLVSDEETAALVMEM